MSTTTANRLSPIPLTGLHTATEVPIPETTPSRVALLTRRLAAGDEEAFREFHALYFDRLYQFLLAVTLGQEHEAQEALQQTLLRVVRYAREFDQEDAFWCWLKVVARSAARDAGRKHRRYLNLLEHFALRGRPSSTHDDGTEENSLRSALAESLDELAPDDRQLLERKYIEGAAVRELSAAAGLSEKAVESRLLRLRRDLKGRLMKKLRDYETSG